MICSIKQLFLFFSIFPTKDYFLKFLSLVALFDNAFI